jgi:Zn-dependent M28 family amino/carboxypeptidase
VLFTAWTAEERGLLGSEYYAQHPLYPMETMAANLTFDTLQWAGPVKDAVLVGKGQSEMERYLEEAARAQERYVTPENHPERGLFYRADHFSFAKRGVPVLLDMALAGAYDMVDGGREAGNRWLDAFTTNCYHQPCDA